MNVLVTSAGRRVSLVRSFQQALKKHFPKALVFAADAKPATSAACHAADKSMEVPLLKEANYIDFLLEKCLEHNITLIVPTIDTELLLLAQNKELFSKNGIHVVIASEEFVQKCRDKRKIHDFFESHGIDVAKEYAKDNYVLPLFIKPIDGSRSVDTYIIKSQHELQEYHFTNEKLMFLEYLDHDKFAEYTCDLYYDKHHRLRCVVPRKRLEVRDGEVNKGLTVQNELVPYIKNHLSFIEGAEGCLTAQFFMDQSENKIFGVEINPRFGGGYPLSYLAGANYSEWLIKEYMLDQNIPDSFDTWERDLLMIRYDHEILVHGFKG